MACQTMNGVHQNGVLVEFCLCLLTVCDTCVSIFRAVVRNNLEGNFEANDIFWDMCARFYGCSWGCMIGALTER